MLFVLFCPPAKGDPVRVKGQEAVAVRCDGLFGCNRTLDLFTTFVSEKAFIFFRSSSIVNLLVLGITMTTLIT